MTTTPTKKSTRHRGLHLSRTKRKALRRRSQPAFRYWKFLTHCFTSLRRRPAFRLIRAFKRLRAAFGALALACWLPGLAQAETFDPIHRFDGTEHHAYEGRPVTITETENGVTIIDEAPPAGRVFYRLRVTLAE